jgi:polysaccharide pyruvyl transferase WcaK-like protein
MIWHVYANRSNIGDWLSAQGIQSLLAPLPVRELLCDTPFAASTLAALASAAPDDLIVIGGGGLFMDYFAPFWEGFQPIAKRVPFCLWGVGCCDLKRFPSRPSQRLMLEIVDRSQFSVVRDQLTRDFVGDSRLPPPVPCPTFNAISPVAGEGKWVLHVDHFDSIGAERYERMVEIARADAARTGHGYRQTNNLIPAGHREALRRTLDLYASADRVITSRLHGCILALALGRRVVAVSGDHKVESFMEAAGLGDWVCALDEVNRLPDWLETLHKQRPPIEFTPQAREQNLAVACRVLALLRLTQPVTTAA